MGGVGPGEVLNSRYELIDRIGGGSMGEVWRGRDLVLGRTVAVKIVLPTLLDAPTFLQRFEAEARVMAMMDHPGIVGVFDYGYTPAEGGGGGTAFLVMEFIDGESLDRVLSRLGPLEPGFVLETMASLLDALAAVHRQGVVHRDIKPGNVMLRQEGVVLADFGIARSPESLGLTAADKLMGTVPYLAPELFRSEAPATPAADVYAVGILAFELLDGLPPFHASTTAAVMFKHVNEPPPPLPEYVPAELVALLDRALAKNPVDRWPDAAAMAVAVRAVLAGGSVPEWEPVVAEPVRRRSGSAPAGSGAGDDSPGSGERDRERVGGGRHGSGGAERDVAWTEEDLRPVGPAGEVEGAWRDDSGERRVGGGRHGSGGDERDAAWAEGGAPDYSRDVPGRHGSGRHGSDGTERDAAWSEGVGVGVGVGAGAGAGAGGQRGGRHSTEVELHATAVMRRNGGVGGVGRSGTGETDRPNRRKALIPVAGGVAAVALAVVVVAASQGSGSSGANRSGDQGQQAGAPTVPNGGFSSAIDLPTPSQGASSSRPHSAATAGGPSHTGTRAASGVPGTPTGSGAPSGTNSATAGQLTPSGGNSSEASTSPSSSAASTSPSTSATSVTMVTVPDVTTGSPLMDAAHTTLTQASFKFSDNKTGPGAGTPTNCHVTHQTPAANSPAPAGSTVALDETCS